MRELIQKIKTLKAELDALKPLAKEWEDVLWEKLRLEWNYNSNHIEGNTLTYGDTKLLLRLGDDFKAQNNSLKDVNEMRAHDAAIFLIRDWSKDDKRGLIENDIRALNEMILVKDYWADAQTSDGKPTKRLIKVGNYKELPNHVKLKSGETFEYAEPHEVGAKMKELMDWYNSNQDEHPVITAAFFHYKFVIIHPFDDGNGRVSRLLMNFHLMKNGFPPIIIKSQDKPNYLYALNQADAGNTDAFVEYLGNQLIWSLELSVKAAKGEPISEQDDLYKEIEVWKKQVQSGLPTNPKRSDKLSMAVYDKTIAQLFADIESKAITFKELFLEHKFKRSYKNLKGGFIIYRPSHLEQFRNREKDVLEKFKLNLELIAPLSKPSGNKSKTSVNILVNLNVFDYTFMIDNKDPGIKKSYNEFLTKEEQNQLTSAVINNLFEKVKKVSG